MASATTCDHVDQGLTKVWQVGLIAGFTHPLHSLFSSGLPRVCSIYPTSSPWEVLAAHWSLAQRWR